MENIDSYPFFLFKPHTIVGKSVKDVCEELQIPIEKNELKEVCPSWHSPELGQLYPESSAEKKVQEYFIDNLKNLENEQFGFFYKIKNPSGKTCGYLFGTVHDMTSIGKPLKLHKKIYRSLDKSEAVAFEIDPVAWREKLFNDTKYAMAIELKSAQKMDLEFGLLAREKNKTICDLEGIEHHIMSLQTGKEISSGNNSSLHKALYESSEEKLEEFLKETDSLKETKQLDKRNKKMTDKIDQLLNRCKNVRAFIAVGAAHMVGKKGISKLLSEKGYKIEQVKSLSSGKKSFFNLSKETLSFIARSVSRTPFEEHVPINRKMALYNIVQSLLKKGSKKSVYDKAIFITEKISSSIHREEAFSAIAKYAAEKGDIEKALHAAFKMKEKTTNRSDTIEYIANILVEQGDAKRALEIMKKHSSSSHFRYYPGKTALKLAEKGKFRDAIDLVNVFIHSNIDLKHRNAAFAAVALTMARKGEIEGARKIIEKYVGEGYFKKAIMASINRISTSKEIDKELEKVICSGSDAYMYISLDDDKMEYCLYEVFTILRKYQLEQAFCNRDSFEE